MDKSGSSLLRNSRPVTFISIHSSPQQGCQLSVVLSFQVGAKLNIHAKYVLGVPAILQDLKECRNVQHSHFLGDIPLIMQHILDILVVPTHCKIKKIRFHPSFKHFQRVEVLNCHFLPTKTHLVQKYLLSLRKWKTFTSSSSEAPVSIGCS